MKSMGAVVAAAAFVFAVSWGNGAGAASLEKVHIFAPNPGDLELFTYRPDGLPPGSPLVVLLHGCKQRASDYDNETGWTKYADAWGFALALPQQPAANNATRCFNWFSETDNSRGNGEARSIAAAVDYMVQQQKVDPKRIYITGLSAGGAMTAAMLATYPELFQGGAVVAGVPYGCASGPMSGSRCMLFPRDLEPVEWGDLVRAATDGYQGPWPKVTVWHGLADWVVKPGNVAELMEQWTNVHGIDQAPDQEDKIKGQRHRAYADATGQVLVETYEITDMDHGTPIDPGEAADQCGTASPYILNAGICSAYFTARQWGLEPSAEAPAKAR